MTIVKNLIKDFSTIQNNRVLDLLEKKKNISLSGTCNFAAKAFIFADVIREKQDLKTVLWVVNDAVEQDHVIRALRFWSDIDVVPYNFEQPAYDNVRATEEFNRINAIELVVALKSKDRKVIVAPYSDLMNTFPDYKEIEKRIFTLKKGDNVNLTEVFENLIDSGYEVSTDPSVQKGTYYKTGEILTVFPVYFDYPVKIDVGFDRIESITLFDPETKEEFGELDDIDIIPTKCGGDSKKLSTYFSGHLMVVEDELDVIDDYFEGWSELFDEVYGKICSIAFVSFNEDDEGHSHLHYISVMKYRGSYDLINDLRDKKRNQWRMVVFTKDKSEITGILKGNNFEYSEDLSRAGTLPGVYIVTIDKENVAPAAFQNPEIKLMVVSDKEISSLKEDKKKHYSEKVYLDFLTSLKFNDYVVHANHGIGRFMGLEKRTIDDVTREYLKIGYAENDKLFVPIDQADKVNKYIGADEQPPKLTRLGSAEWNTITRKVQKETEEIAKELLKLYAERKSAKAFKCIEDEALINRFADAFPYEETPGQLKSINDVREDLTKAEPMDRLICGDVGFGKTEVAMRAAFSVIKSGKQVAFIAPITILADQHYRSFIKRMEPFDVRIELLSRFRSPKEQKEIIGRLSKGEVDIVIGTHRLIQPDVKFKDLGLVIVDEEQRFGVKQKEAFKKMKTEVHVLTLTATPIPRTLNIALNKLRDISTITTPPPGRLPIITEVRRYSQGLIRDSILREISRGGQIYFLHNRVQTINGMADKLGVLFQKRVLGLRMGSLEVVSLKKEFCLLRIINLMCLLVLQLLKMGLILPMLIH